jgi:hypothetical protein
VQQRTTIFAAVLAFGLADLGVALAQPVYGGPRGYDLHAYGTGGRVYDGSLLPFEIMRIVRSHGLAPLSRPARREGYYEVIAGTRSGGQTRVVVDAFTGDILKVNPLQAGGPNGPRFAAPYDPSLPPRPVAPYGGPPDPMLGMAPQNRFDDGMPPVPPRAVPGARIANAPPAEAAAPVARPERTPMPRPRPQLAVSEAPVEAPTLAGAPPPEQPKPAAKPAVAPKPAAAPAVPVRATTMVPVAPLE